MHHTVVQFMRCAVNGDVGDARPNGRTGARDAMGHR
jgi:hypothetical protein